MYNPGHIVVNGIRTRCLEAGHGAPMLLVHGGHFGRGGCAEDWELNFDTLSQHFKVYAIDKLGMGFTDNPLRDDDYVIDSQARHIYDFIEELGLKRVHLVGHSRGGYAVTRLALDYPDRVASLIIVNSSSVINPFNPIYNEWRTKAADMTPREGIQYLLAANSHSDRHITDHLVDTELQIRNLPKTQVAKTKMDHGLFKVFRSDLLQRVNELKQEVEAGHLKVPTLLLWGFNDPSATMERCGKPAMDLFLRTVADSEAHIFNHAGHFCFREQPDAFNRVVIDYIQRRAGGSPLFSKTSAHRRNAH